MQTPSDNDEDLNEYYFPEEARLRRIERAIDWILAHINAYEHTKPYLRQPKPANPDQS